jgi:hypothetical protein
MKKKTLMLISLSLFLFIMVMPSALAFGMSDFFTLITDFSNGYNQFKDAYNYIAMAILTMAVFTIGSKGVSKLLGWDDSNAKNAITAFIAVVGIGGGLGIFHQLRAINVYPLDFFGKFGGLGIAIIVFFWLFSFFYKGEGGNPRIKYFVMAVVIILLFYALEAMFPGFPVNLGGYETLIYLVLSIAVIYILFEMFVVAISAFSSVRAQNPLSDSDYEGTKTAIRQRGGIKAAEEEKKVAKQAAKKERKSRHAIRKLGPLLKKSADIVARLQKSIATTSPTNISGKWRLFRSDLEDLVDYSTRIGAFAGLISMIAAEVSALPVAKVPPALRTKMEALEKSILADFKKLQDDIKDINTGIRNVHKKNGDANKNWALAGNAIKRAIPRLNQIENDALGIQTLEVQVKKIA